MSQEPPTSDKLAVKRQKAEKAALRRIKKCMQPKECLKHVTVLLDDRLANHERLGPALIGCLNGQQVARLESEQQRLPAMRWRRNVHVLDLEAIASLARDALDGAGFEELEEDALVVMEGRQLAALLSSDQPGALESALFGPGADWCPTLVVFELERHVTQTSRAAEGNALRAKVQNQPPPGQRRPKKDETAAAAVTRLQCEEAFLDLQLARGVTVRVVEDPVQLGKLAYCLTKAVAERPFKAARLESAFSFHVADDLWRCQLQCFPLVTGEVARAIQRAYPTPGHLLKAYAACPSPEEAVRLIADLQLSKGTGPLSTSRRLGPELGKRIYAFYSSRDPNLVL